MLRFVLQLISLAGLHSGATITCKGDGFDCSFPLKSYQVNFHDDSRTMVCLLMLSLFNDERKSLAVMF